MKIVRPFVDIFLYIPNATNTTAFSSIKSKRLNVFRVQKRQFSFGSKRYTFYFHFEPILVCVFRQTIDVSLIKLYIVLR